MTQTQALFKIATAKKITDFRLGELFCGPGGLALGAISSCVETKEDIYKIKHAWANDYHQDTCKTYARNICPDNPGNVVCQDICKLDIKNLSSIDAFAYGFPCNDFSIVGEQKGFRGKFGPLYIYGLNILDYFKPKFFLAENVGGIATANGGKAFKKIVSDLENAGPGYNLTINLYKAEEYGIAQTRHRMIIVGIDKTMGLKFQVPVPTTKLKPHTVKEALENPPIPDNASNNEFTAQSKNVVERLKHIKPGENVWTADLPKHLRLNVKGAKLSQIYKRLDPDKPSYTLTGSGGGGTHGYHWKENRALTNRERARIQSFPDDFILEGSKESVRRQIGMAVPPLLATTIFTAVLKTFAGIKYPCVQANWGSQLTLFK
ncbi:MAG: DNA cytosine methyltransferase [Candidatus Omnitrophica bacterium]|nr:DNA cytosine methyltransferase [Candidatus Omnitrophota bacterium]